MEGVPVRRPSRAFALRVDLAFMACLPFSVETVVFNGWLCVVRHAIHATPEAGHLSHGRRRA